MNCETKLCQLFEPLTSSFTIRYARPAGVRYQSPYKDRATDGMICPGVTVSATSCFMCIDGASEDFDCHVGETRASPEQYWQIGELAILSGK